MTATTVPPTITPRAITVEAAARRLGIGRTTLYQLMTEGRLPFHQIGRARRLDPVDVEQFWRSCKCYGAQHHECCVTTGTSSG